MQWEFKLIQPDLPLSTNAATERLIASRAPMRQKEVALRKPPFFHNMRLVGEHEIKSVLRAF